MWYWYWNDSENRNELWNDEDNLIAFVYYDNDDGWTWIEASTDCGQYGYDIMEEAQDDCLKHLRGRK